MENQIEIYTTQDNETAVEVQFDKETVWLTQAQMADLFDRNRVAITQHIGNIFKDEELDKKLVCKDFLQTTQHGAIKGKTQSRKVKYYNLDVIISVGYRVKSKRGTQFRQWATKRLKDYLVQGYAVNEKRLEHKQQEVRHLKDGIRILSRAIEEKAGDMEFKWLNMYAAGLRLLDDYDHETLDKKGTSDKSVTYPSYEEYMAMVDNMRTDFNSEVFGQERGDGFKSAIEQIRQEFDKKELYPTFEEKAATLLLFDC